MKRPFDSRLVVSVEEARKILGKEISDKMSDEEIENTIMQLDEIARLTIRGILDGSINIPERANKGKYIGGRTP